jgi:hypothetical protein
LLFLKSMALPNEVTGLKVEESPETIILE